MPPALPDPPQLDVAARYDAADTPDIGGDFYDLLPTSTGWLMVLGDVGGKGIPAASLSSLARHSMHAAAVQQPEPTHLLGVLNDALVRHDPESFCTAVCAHMQTGAHYARLTPCYTDGPTQARRTDTTGNDALFGIERLASPPCSPLLCAPS